MKIYKYLLRDERTSKYKEAVQDFLWQLKVAHCKDRNDQFDCWGDDSIPFSEQMYKPEEIVKKANELYAYVCEKK